MTPVLGEEIFSRDKLGGAPTRHRIPATKSRQGGGRARSYAGAGWEGRSWRELERHNQGVVGPRVAQQQAPERDVTVGRWGWKSQRQSDTFWSGVARAASKDVEVE